MKKIIAFFLLFMIHAESFAANKILLTGKPVVLIPRNDFYIFPKTYTPIHNYHFVDISGDNRVCFISPQIELQPLDMLKIYIVLQDKKYLWYCYRFSHDFFTIDF